MMKYINDYTLLISLLRCIFCVIILLPKRCCGAHYQYEVCKPKNCSNGPNISFPFYISGVQESYCGCPGFALNCNEDGFPVLQLPGNDNLVVVDDIFYENRSFHVHIAAVSKSDGSNCFPGIRNTTIHAAQLDYVNPMGQLYLFSGCREPLPETLVRYNMSCGGEKNWDLALYGEDENLGKAIENCDRNVVAPAELEYGYDPTVNVAEVLRRGFLLQWTTAVDRSKTVNSASSERKKRRSILGKTGKKTSREFLLRGGPITIIAFISTSILLFLFIRKKYTTLKPFQHQKTMPDNKKDIECFLKNNGNLGPIRYKYSDLKKITKSFSEKLGKGGYGSVYEGKLPDGRLVAVKILNESKGNGEEFMNEVASICRTSHINIVTLVGFCFEGSSKRALVYEFMPNGSLEKFIHDPSSSTEENRLGPKKLFEIAVGIAQGLDYLHRGCNMRIVHFDIKPHNILLDKDFNPKISDFGLAKLCPNRSSIVSMMFARGTIGYIAPEVFSRNFGEVSHKSDVYSYGMMILEMAVGRQNVDAQGNRSSEMYFPDWIYKCLQENTVMGIDSIMSEEEELQMLVKKMIIVGLWCIQTEPKNRPSISRVVEMLQGTIESLQVPPKPYLFSPPTTAADALTFESSVSQPILYSPSVFS